MAYALGTTEELPREETDNLLRAARYGRLGLAFENEAYVVPVYHYYDGQSIRFHIGKEGKTTTYLQANPQACFQVDEVSERGWRSAICYGEVTLSESIDSKREHFGNIGVGVPGDEELQRLPVFIGTLRIEEITGRKSLPVQ
ncbi:MAG: pyridoxamine 5'-phosphate oxidase family protein [Dehalococcoidia bacterium]|nr:pyridoxamine 5'-phosphate oxidase family protein [Dehalococcoidia bacterium]